MADFLLGTSVRSLHGRFCSRNVFDHDIAVHAFADRQAQNGQETQHDTKTTADSLEQPSLPVILSNPAQPAVSRFGGTSPDQLLRKADTVAKKFTTPLEDTQPSAYEDGTTETGDPKTVLRYGDIDGNRRSHTVPATHRGSCRSLGIVIS